MSCLTHLTIPNRAGQRLTGILHEPSSDSARGVCVLLLSPGIKGRVGPHRLYLKIALPLTEIGFHVLRFDFHGLGDSDGVLPEDRLADVYYQIQAGRYVEDTKAVMDWLQQRRGLRNFVASGLCGGSLTGLLTAAVDHRIQSVLGLGVPVVLETEASEWGQHLTRNQLSSLRRGYMGRVLNPNSWGRFLTGRSSYRVLFKSLLSARRQRVRKDSSSIPVDNTNPRFAPAFLSVLRSGRPVLLVFSGGDRLGWEFQEKFAERHPAEMNEVRALLEIHTIEYANHVLSDPRWVHEFLAISLPWLERAHSRA